MNILSWLQAYNDAELCELIGIALLHSTWQILSFGAVVGITQVLVPATAARLRYAINVACLVGIALSFVTTIMWASYGVAGQVNSDAPRVTTAALTDLTSPAPQNRISNPYVTPPTATDDRSSVSSSSQRRPTTDRTTTVAAFGTLRPSATWHPMLVSAWSIGLLLMIMRLLAANLIVGSYRYRSYAVIEPDILELLHTISRRYRLRYVPRMAWCSCVGVPVVAGVLRPIILLPPVLQSQATLEDVSVVLSHELAHLARWDHVVNFLQRLVEAIFFFHPAVWYISWRTSIERENCCDDVVIRDGCARTAYAASLVRLAELTYRDNLALAHVGLFRRRPSELSRRIQRILLATTPGRGGDRGVFTLTLVLLCFAICVGVPHLFADDADPLTSQQQFSSDASVRRRLLDAEIVAVLGDERGRLRGGSFSLVLSPDEKRVYTANVTGEVAAYDAETLQRVFDFQAHPKRCTDLALFHGGTRLVSIGIDGTARLWSLEHMPPQLLDVLSMNATGEPTWLNMQSARRPMVVLRSEDRMIVVDVTTTSLIERAKIPRRTANIPFQYDISADGRWLVTQENINGANRNTVEFEGRSYNDPDMRLVLWDLATPMPEVADEVIGKSTDGIMFDPREPIFYTLPRLFKPDEPVGKWEVRDRTINRNTTADQSAEISFPPGRIVSHAGWSEFDHMGNRYVRPAGDEVLLIVRAESSWRVQHTIPTSAIAAVLCENGSVILAKSQVLERWDVVGERHRLRFATKGPSGARVDNMMYLPHTGELVAAGDALYRWKTSPLAHPEHPTMTKLPYSRVSDIEVWKRDGSLLLNGTAKGKNFVQGGVTDKTSVFRESFRIAFGEDRRSDCWHVAGHPHENVIATGHWDGTIKLWNVAAKETVVLKEWQAHSGQFRELVFSPDGSQLLAAGTQSAKVWKIDLSRIDVNPPGATWLVGPKSEITAGAVADQGNLLAVASDAAKVWVWRTDALSAPPVELVLPSAPASTENFHDRCQVTSITFDASSENLLAADVQGYITLWNVPTAKLVRQWRMPSSVSAARFSPDDQQIAVANDDGTIFLLKNPQALD